MKQLLTSSCILSMIESYERMMQMPRSVVGEIRDQVPAGFAIGSIVIEGEYVTNGGAGETLLGNYKIKFELNEDDEIEFDGIQFISADSKFDVLESADELLASGFNWWIENAESA